MIYLENTLYLIDRLRSYLTNVYTPASYFLPNVCEPNKK
jgi:hypothetical protein